MEPGSSQHHAPWRLESVNGRRGSLSPDIYESHRLDALKPLKLTRFILSACDYSFFEQHQQNIVKYEASGCELIYVLGVFSVKAESGLIAQKLDEFRDKNGLKKFVPFVYGNSNLEWILNQQKDVKMVGL